MIQNGIFTSECVTWGHPDVVASTISDAIVTEVIKKDPNARVAAETMVHSDGVVVAGEVTTTAEYDVDQITRRVLKDIGYDKEDSHFEYDKVKVENHIHRQSPDIALGTNDSVGGAGDQGMMFGGATSETEEYMPKPMSLARKLCVNYTDTFLPDHDQYRTDAKSQVSIRYEDGEPQEITAVVMSVAHTKDIDIETLRNEIEEFIETTLDGEDLSDAKIFINPTGAFTEYGPYADCGLTGRKIIVDTYGGYFSHGGGAFSSKDPSKVDRSGAYMARYIAKNIVAAGFAKRCEVEIAYAIGVPEPVSVSIQADGLKVTEDDLVSAIYQVFDMTPKGITKTFEMRSGKIKYDLLPKYGHFGEQGEITRPWEVVDKVDELKKVLGV